ncbi:MAG: tRNA (adenosine(37)-N6)-threonylcarbamoyltransferase complex transferase subunit TsaD [Treponema sp.]|jgi:N6-L-threonylcarbamoyladenine synthase|nr:tRNA (adenosine(37)-N6)-threonylcarbamoyltransferase complex transferase subunit TsaD [Treponema sp.]
MKVLGIETSCDECASAVVEDGKKVLSNVVATQIPFHAPYNGVVPEIASRKHTEWIYNVVKEALDRASLEPRDIDAIAVTNRPGLLGSLLVGVSFAKAFAWARNIPLIAVDHMMAHLYASQLSAGEAPSYPFLGLLVSGGHSIICRADTFDQITVLGATIDDAAGEAFDKVAKHYKFGYPGGAVIDRMAKNGDSTAFRFPMPRLQEKARLPKGAYRCDVSYSGLKNAVINQLEQFRVKKDSEIKPEDIAASFQKTAVEILLRALFNAVEDSGLSTIVSGGGVAANSYLRWRLAEKQNLRCIFPPPEFCGDNGAMIAGIGYHYLVRGDRSPLSVSASARVEGFKKKYP